MPANVVSPPYCHPSEVSSTIITPSITSASVQCDHCVKKWCEMRASLVKTVFTTTVEISR
jgi:hypothetical protein